MSANDHLIADIIAAQQRLQDLFMQDRADPLFDSNLTMQQLKVLMLLRRLGDTSGRELAGLMSVSLATLSGMVDRLVAHDLATRTEDPHDRRVRRITLSPHGRDVVDKIANAGADLQLRLLNRLSESELHAVRDGIQAMIRAASEEAAPKPQRKEALGALRDD
ncbi:MarR family winged helix-turn-helix transcriptional regulator [Symbioplanes lichenis]|uniref:MarR family winged helix-turn-helix transcriptional regulator n=1 Tax=Symbioplanes lichenis TaxID=1629072 RepID=UPI0027382971|nr:MarR family transcriptional regulator [Actinoplanes lichenis]